MALRRTGVSIRGLAEHAHRRLRELVSAGLLTREAYAKIPPRIEYRATEKADDLKPTFAHLYAWIGRHELGSGTEERAGSN